MMIQFSEDYNAQTIFDQVWEHPYEWFSHPILWSAKLPSFIWEMDGDEIIGEHTVTIEKIEKATINYYLEYVSKHIGDWARTMSNYLEDLDADDVDCILQLACFEEIRYG